MMTKISFAIRKMRDEYFRVCQSLPWLDMSVWEDDYPAFKGYGINITIPYIKSATLDTSMKGNLSRLKNERKIYLLRYSPLMGPLNNLHDFFYEMEKLKIPLVILHTDTDLNLLESIALLYPSMSFILESGPAKILYFIDKIETLMLRCHNIFLCSYNLCNWMALERLCRKGFRHRILFGSHQPRYNPHASIGPIVMGMLTWEEKCDIAGNNLRRLLGITEKKVPEVLFQMPAPFIIDAHTHTGMVVGAPEQFTVPDTEFGPTIWREFMNSCAIEVCFVCPSESLVDPSANSEYLTENLRKILPGRIFFFTPFFPRGEQKLDDFVNYLKKDDCIGIKIHPSFHKIAADDVRYNVVYEIAERYDVPIMTHSWDISEKNPLQHLSYPGRFRKHLLQHPNIKLILGHAGGRPGAFDAVKDLCNEFHNVMVDISGDYYDNGLIEKLVDSIGVDRIIFGSDLNWIDPRANLSAVLASALSDEDIGKILRKNALIYYSRASLSSGLP